MNNFLFFLYLCYFLLITQSLAKISETTNVSNLISCLNSSNIHNYTIFSYPTPPSTYTTILNFSIHNLRFTGPTVPKPVVIVLPGSKADLRDAVLCFRNASLAIRLRSGGHSYEGLSYTTTKHVQFGIIDLLNLNSVQVDSDSATLWAESGATLGEMYYAVAKQTNGSLALSAGSCSTVGSGGHIAGGGFGLLSRKYGLGADNVIDAILIDSNGREFSRESMDEDVFWAIRGGGGGSWGVVFAWKLQLVPIPNKLTVFTPSRTGSPSSIAELVYKWQLVGPSLPDEFYLSVYMSGLSNSANVSVSFTGQFLGPKSTAMLTLNQRFPELELVDSDFTELSWIDSVVLYANVDSIKSLTSRVAPSLSYFKTKSDYVRVPISYGDLIKALHLLTTKSGSSMQFDPYGGVMARIPTNHIAFPHRAGYLYSIQYSISWTKDEDKNRDDYVSWIRGFHVYLGQFVSKSPRAAYVNYIDLDLGIINWSDNGEMPSNGVLLGRVYGDKYFGENYDRLVKAKAQIDPHNVFHHEQSIPPLT